MGESRCNRAAEIFFARAFAERRKSLSFRAVGELDLARCVAVSAATYLRQVRASEPLGQLVLETSEPGLSTDWHFGQSSAWRSRTVPPKGAFDRSAPRLLRAVQDRRVRSGSIRTVVVTPAQPCAGRRVLRALSNRLAQFGSGHGTHSKMECQMLKHHRPSRLNEPSPKSASRAQDSRFDLNWKWVLLWRLKPPHPPSKL